MFDDKEIHQQQEPSTEFNGRQEAIESGAETQNPVMDLPEIPEVKAMAASESGDPNGEAPHRRSGRGWKIFGAAFALVAMGAAVGGATTWALAREFQPVPIGYNMAARSTVPTQTVAAGPFANSNVIPGIYKAVSPAVVAISVQVQQGWQTGQAKGSGFVVDPKGYILTNYHVVNGAKSITVDFIDGSTAKGTVVGSDRFKDLAVVKIDPPAGKTLVAATLGNSDNVQVGEMAIAIGSPYDQDFTVTAGIVSGLDRSVDEQNNPVPIPGAIQTDAAINPGNSGGPLLNANGEVIGINTAIESPVQGSIGLGFAIPINMAKSILPSMIQGQKVNYGYLGVTVGTLDAKTAKQLKVNVNKGAVIEDVVPDGPADKAGLQPAAFTQSGNLVSADVVTAVDNQPIASSSDLVKYIQSKHSGDKVVLTVLRGSDQVSVTVTLGNLADAQQEQQQQQQQQNNNPFGNFFGNGN